MKRDYVMELMDIVESDPDGLYSAVTIYTYSDAVYEDEDCASSNFESGYSIWICVDGGKTRTVTLSNLELLGMYRRFIATMR